MPTGNASDTIIEAKNRKYVSISKYATFIIKEKYMND